MMAHTLPVYNIGGADWALTQALYHAQAHLGQPALNLIWPLQPYVCIGRFQDLDLEVDVAECQRRGLPIVRREVGGGAVYLDGRQVFYQLVLPLDWLGPSYSYRWLFRLGLDAVALALKRLGVNADIRGANDVVVGQRKISGNGAGEVGRAAVVVGNILMDFDYETMAAVLRVPDEKFRDKAYRSMKDNLTTLAELEPSIGNKEAAAALAQAFAEILPPEFQIRPTTFLPVEATTFWPKVARRLTDEAWLHEVQLRQEQRRLRIRQGLELRLHTWKAPGGLLRCQCAVESGQDSGDTSAPHLSWLALSGDFFMHPPQALAELEEALTGVSLASVKEVAARFLAWPGVAMPGVSPEDIERVVTGRSS
mgnify:CR=1 FL=1